MDGCSLNFTGMQAARPIKRSAQSTSIFDECHFAGLILSRVHVSALMFAHSLSHSLPEFLILLFLLYCTSLSFSLRSALH